MRSRRLPAGTFLLKPRQSACIPIRPRRSLLLPNLTGFFARPRPNRENCSPYSALVMPNLLDSCPPMTRLPLIRVIALLGTLAEACALSGWTTQEGASRLLVEPDRYVLYSCPEIATAAQAKMARQRDSRG